jgi:hypothetical protein
MPINYKVPAYAYNLPWFIFDIYNLQLITSQTVPGDISDTKAINLNETSIPGLNFAPVNFGGNGNKKIKFTIPILKRNNTAGNSMALQQFRALRNQATGLFNLTGQQFTPNPKVLFYWGVGSVPLIYFVKAVDFSHKSQWQNQQGQPQYTDVSIELWLDETDPLYQAEKLFRDISIITNQGVDGINNTFNPLNGRQF